jgi:hypothetical protein
VPINNIRSGWRASRPRSTDGTERSRVADCAQGVARTYRRLPNDLASPQSLTRVGAFVNMCTWRSRWRGQPNHDRMTLMFSDDNENDGSTSSGATNAAHVSRVR